MATKTSFPALLDTLTQALSSALESTEKLSAPIPPKDGISLLDVKNELFLSYLQNLVFLIILKLRNRKSGSSSGAGDENLDNAVVKKLVEFQVYLEKGVRPLEGRLKYQIDKVLRAADDAKRAEDAAKPNFNGKATREIDSDDGSEEGSDDESDAGVALQAVEIDDLQYRPNPSLFVRPVETADAETSGRSEDGIYRPPRIQATAMPTTGLREKAERKPNKSATLDEFVSTELSVAPLAEPSIGSTIISGGRRSKSEREKKEEAERREYEEKNYVRLPKESKKERAKKKGGREAGYGGEEWRGLGEGIDRIDRLTKRKAGAGRSVLEKSRKRSTEDGPRGSGGAEVGQGFQKRLKALDGGRRDRGRGPK
ncbi:Sas10/Utp3/C1D family-domain-containing protein [Tricladium varicosporioides]|nr:Sas10/Utp3/C1D family-domain-containing protein [Hymenoscyphus varicosporioides]